MKKFAEYFKQREEDYDFRLLADRDYIVRLDGRKFSTFMKNRKEKSQEFKTAMVNTTIELMKQNPSIKFAYTQSDEISLVFSVKHGIPYNGRVVKNLTILSGLCSTIFNKEFPNTDFPHFDARVLETKDDKEIVNNILWRMRDCERNWKKKTTNPELIYGTLIKRTKVMKQSVERTGFEESSRHYSSAAELNEVLGYNVN